MNELATFPTSIRTRLDEAKNLLAQDRPQEASATLASVHQELAKTNPELCAFVLALSQGCRGMSLTVSERTESIERIDRMLLGVKLGTTLVPVVTNRVVRRSWEVW